MDMRRDAYGGKFSETKWTKADRFFMVATSIGWIALGLILAHDSYDDVTPSTPDDSCTKVVETRFIPVNPKSILIMSYFGVGD